MKVVCQGNIFTLHDDEMKTFDKLPALVYTVGFSKNMGFFLELSSDIEIKENKVYGVQNEKSEKVLNSFHNSDRNLGVILSGDKGIGKSLFAKLLSSKAVSKGLPVVIVDSYIPGVASYLGSINQECLVLFDEFDKTFGEVEAPEGHAQPQTELLTLFDGLIPGRFHYHFRFEYPTAQEIREYLQDKLNNKYYSQITEVVAFSRKVKLNYDALRAIAFELNQGISFSEAIRDLNILNIKNEQYTATLHWSNGYTASAKDVYLDLFDDDSDNRVWLCDKNGFDIANVSFNSSDAHWDDKIGHNIVDGNKVNVTYCNFDADNEYEVSVNRSAREAQVLYLVLKRDLSKSLHYAL